MLFQGLRTQRERSFEKHLSCDRGQAWQLALQRLDAGQLGALRANLESAAQQGVLSAQQLAQANEQILGESFKRLGVNAAQAMGRVSEGAQQAIDSVALVADGVKTAGLSAEDAARSRK